MTQVKPHSKPRLDRITKGGKKSKINLHSAMEYSRIYEVGLFWTYVTGRILDKIRLLVCVICDTGQIVGP